MISSLHVNIKSIPYLLVLLLCSCETYKYDYEVVEIDSETGIVNVSTDEFVIDSINIGKGNVSVYSASLNDKRKGASSINIFADSVPNYRIYRNDMQTMCADTTFNYSNSVNIYIRNEKYYGRDLLVDRKYVQRFNTAILPCGSKKITLHAIRRH
ncbi:MAG: hypothetical protein EOO51_13305 [Flavobacterium sp.]|nr:MAG: hypothetical protein EOO51_13305 [Flavobacterium sp.]